MPMPELPEVETVRRGLQPVLEGALIVRVEARRADLRFPLPPRFSQRLTGRRVTDIARRAKFLLLYLDGPGPVLICHLGMSGSFRIEAEHAVSAPGAFHHPRSKDAGHDHIVFHVVSADGQPRRIVFNDPRRFGVMDLVAVEGAATHDALDALGPEPLNAAFDAAVLARACAGKRVSLKVALLDQRIVAGVGNIYASEALHHARLSPRRRASTIATRAGAPRDAAVRLVTGIKAVLRKAIARKEQAYRGGRFRVYEREGQPCLRPRCPGTIRRITQAGRSTYYCPTCQR